MIDKYKTSVLRERLQKEKEKESTSTTQESEINAADSAISFLLSFIIAYFVFYGSQWLLLNHFSQAPFSMLESFVFYLLLRTFFQKR
jgi:hypothetical protein